ncbi:MAG TPA: hypothetical protein VF517_00270 [Thermoleophilaceae bacterium]|jgi:hypothetical protein
MADTFLRIYMNDQLAAGLVFRELARRSQRSNAGTELGDALERVASAIAEDIETFERMMERLHLPRNRVKSVLALGGERAGRLKLNGRVRSYSPLSRFVELDALAIGIDGKKLLWSNLRDHANLAKRLPDVDFDHLIERAQWQRDQLEPFRAKAGSESLGA